MQIGRRFALSLILGGLLCLGAGCANRGTAPPLIEAVGPAPPRSDDPMLRLATANLWGVSVLGLDWADDIDERFAAMAERLTANTPRLDVVLLQEAWKDRARRALLNHAGVMRNFPFRVDVVERPGGAGLVVLSRLPIERAHFHRFEAQGRCLKFWEGDCLSGKGIVTLRLAFGDRSIWIGNTHLIACYSDPDEPETACDRGDPNGADRSRQLIELRRSIEERVGDDPAVLGGDFNLTRTSRYYPLMTRAERRAALPESSTSGIAPARAAPTRPARRWSELYEEDADANRLDYFWVRPGRTLRWHAQHGVRRIFTEPVGLPSGERVPLSDHPILFSEICLVRLDDPENRCLPPHGDAHVRR